MGNNDQELMEMLIKINRMIGPIGDIEYSRGGQCELIDFAKRIEILPQESGDRKVFERALRLCAPFLSKMPSSHIKSLIFLICCSKTPLNVYGEDFLKAFDRWVDGGLFGFDDSDNLLQKAEILRFLAEKRCFSLGRILREEKIREKYPWYWIDAIIFHSLDRAIKEAVKCIEKGEEDKEVQALLMRLPRWISLWDVERLAPIRELNLKKENKEKIEDSFKSRRATNKKEGR